ncbi:MAG: GNAT family N-acetyltransferase [Nitrososphaerota archaeon]
MIDVRPVILANDVVKLEPLGQQHADDLYAVAREPRIWRYLPADPSGSLEEMRAWVAAALQAQESGAQVPFAIVERQSGRAIGSTRYLAISPRDRGLEIGGTWLAVEAQRTGVNTSCKYLLLCHAFEELGAVRVQLKTDSRNDISQRAIERLGAVREGVLRKHMLVLDGYIRDSVMYSILDSEWPAVKARLEGFMRRG